MKKEIKKTIGRFPDLDKYFKMRDGRIEKLEKSFERIEFLLKQKFALKIK